MRAILLCLLIAVACAAAFRISGGASLGGRGIAAGGSLQIRNPLSIIGRPGSQPGPGQPGGQRPGPGPHGGNRPGSPGHVGHHPSHHGKPGHHGHHHRPPIPCHPHRPHRTTTTTTTTTSTTAASTATAADTTSTTESTTSTAASTTDSTTSTTESSTAGATASSTDSSTASSTDSSTASSTDSSTASSTDSSTASSTDSSTASSTESSTASSTDSSTASSTDSSTGTTGTQTPSPGRRRRNISFSFSKSFPAFLGLGGDASGETSEEFAFGNRKRRDVEAVTAASTQSTSPVAQNDTAATSNDADANSESQPKSNLANGSETQPAKQCNGKSPVEPKREVAAPSISIPQFEGLRFLRGWREAAAAVRRGLESAFGSDPKSGLEEATGRALDSSDPEGGLNSLAQTVRNIYEIAAENCPVMIAARFIRDEGRRVAQQILDSLPTVNVSVDVSAGN